MRNIPFWKMSGAGNDFVVVRAGGFAKRPTAGMIRSLCQRREGVGADGLLLIDEASEPFSLRYYNADGSQAFCGNGTRCAAWWLYERGLTKGSREFALRAGRERIRARIVAPGRAALTMPEPTGLSLGLSLRAAGRRVTAHFVDTGVPHAVVFVPDPKTVPVEALGRALREHPRFAPAGANANFAAVRDGVMTLRTYERGVEAETLACGTGAVASALVAAALGRARSPVSVRVRGGQTLKVSFEKIGGSYGCVWLEGPARTVFQGELAL